jgi:hypothetical protein
MTIPLAAQTGFPDIDQAIAEGEYRTAQDLMVSRIAEGGLEETTAYQLQLQSALLDRIKLDFSRDEAYIRETLGAYFPNLTDA